MAKTSKQFIAIVKSKIQDGVKIKVHYCPEWCEYIVSTYSGETCLGTYFTDDRQDAVSTAKHIAGIAG
jgi:hypothetical protein